MGTYGDLMNLNKAQQAPTIGGEQPAERESSSPALKSIAPPTLNKKIKKHIVIPRYHDTTIPSMVSRHHDTIIELIRSAVKTFGKEAATHRFTPDEKKAIADIVYTYKSQSIKTNENEIARIAINFVVNDYKENGENSLLSKAIKALNA